MTDETPYKFSDPDESGIPQKLTVTREDGTQTVGVAANEELRATQPADLEERFADLVRRVELLEAFNRPIGGQQSPVDFHGAALTPHHRIESTTSVPQED